MMGGEGGMGGRDRVDKDMGGGRRGRRSRVSVRFCNDGMAQAGFGSMSGAESDVTWSFDGEWECMSPLAIEQHKLLTRSAKATF